MHILAWNVSVPPSLRIGLRLAYSAIRSVSIEYAMNCPALPLGLVFGDVCDIEFDGQLTVVPRAQGI